MIFQAGVPIQASFSLNDSLQTMESLKYNSFPKDPNRDTELE